jgi:D-sedoheptulose 7-phosphate isomerase
MAIPSAIRTAVEPSVQQRPSTEVAPPREAVERGWARHAAVLLEQSAQLQQRTSETCSEQIATLAQRVVTALRFGGKVLVCADGASAADAQRFAAEFVGPFRQRSRGYPVLALGENGATIAGIASRFGYEQVFAHQVKALAQPGDLLLALSTSGRSPELVRAVQAAHQAQCSTAALCAGQGRPLSDHVDLAVVVPSSDPQRIQEVHTTILHVVAELAEQALG